jgi:hypothetical protein
MTSTGTVLSARLIPRIVAEIGDITQFGILASWAGLTPGTASPTPR